jgi:hypothetical protein
MHISFFGTRRMHQHAQPTRDKRKNKETKHEPGICLGAINLASKPEERAIEHDDGE